jgi:cytochrome c-type biogenesis protein CcmH
MKNIFIKLLLIILLVSPAAWAGDRYPFTDSNQQNRFNQLMQQFRCLVCQNEDLASSNASLAADLRQQIYQMVIAGKSNAEITHYMVNRYGDFVLFKPPLMAETVFIWILPFLLLIGGFSIFYVVIRKYSRNS